MGFDSTSSSSLPPAVIADAFARALAAAGAHVGATAPNPPVGCVLLDAEGGILAVEAHRRAGEAHAEAAAIAAARAAGTAGRIHTVVATLEPCNHTGLTPPCVAAIVGTPAQAVWIGVADPNPRVAGGGAAALAAYGLDVRFIADLDDPAAPRLAAAAERLIAPFAKRVTTGRPFVTVKQALDEAGSMIPPPGAKTFTSEASLTFAHALRKRADAILTGSGTVIADDPAFTVRHVADFAGKRRALVIADRRGRVDPAYVARATARGFDVRITADVEAALERLGAEGALEVLVEAGPTLTHFVLAAGLCDEHVVIRRGGGPDGGDRIEIFHPTAKTP